MMRQLFFKPMLLLSLGLFPVKSHSQGLQRYTNSLFAEYGWAQYNNNTHSFIGKRSNLLSFGLGYQKDMTGFLALGFRVKHYETAGVAQHTYSSNAMQLQLRLQRPRISRTLRLRRFTPYLEAGFGYAGEYTGQYTGAYSAEYAYAVLAAGVDYSFSDHWSLGAQGEYRLSGKNAGRVLDDLQGALNPFNTASLRLNFYFGRNRQRPAVPRIYTRPVASASGIDSGTYADTALPASRTDTLLSTLISTVNALTPPAVTIKDTVLMRIVNAEQKSATAAAGIPPVGVPLLPPAQDTAMRLQANTAVRPDTAAATPQEAAGRDTAMQRMAFKKDSGAVIAKKLAPVPQSDTAFPQQSGLLQKKDTLPTPGTSAGAKLQADTAAVLPAGRRSGADSVLSISRDTVTLYKRDTLTLLRTDTITQWKRDTLTIFKTGATQQTALPPDASGHTIRIDSVSRSPRSRQESTAQLPGIADLPAAGHQGDEGERLQELEAENAALQSRLQQAETGNSGAAVQPLVQPLSGAARKNNTNLVVVPVPLGGGGGRKDKSEPRDKEQHYIAARQDSILQQLSLVQAKLAQLQATSAATGVQYTDTMQPVQADTLDTLAKPGAVTPRADSVQQALQRQIRQLNQENQSLQQMIGTISSLATKDAQDSSGSTAPAAGHDVFFNVNQSVPDTLALRHLLAFSDTLRVSGAYWVLLEGFTDKSGNAAYNLQLSKKRVASVKAVLVEQGIPKEQILEKTFGSRFSTGLINSNDRKVRITQIRR